MSLSCSSESVSSSTQPSGEPALTVEGPVEILCEIVRRYGTPTYAYDLARVRAQVAKLRAHLPPAVEVLYSLKANPSLGLCGALAGCGLGTDVASAGELVTALAAGFSPNRIFLTGPDRSPSVFSHLQSLPEVTISVDSASELRLLASRQPTLFPDGRGQVERAHRALLRLRPDFCSYATCSAGPDSRFGLTLDDLPSCRDHLSAPGVKVVGFHVFSGSQVLSAEGILHHLRGGLDLALRAAGVLGLDPEIIDLGGGFGVPYGPEDRELDLGPIGTELRALRERAAPAQLVLELGRFLVAQSGWYLTTVLAAQTHRGRKAVVVDGGTHQRGDLCGVGLRLKAFAPVVLPLSPLPARGGEASGPRVPTDVLGCLSLPADILAEARPLPPLLPGDVLAFPNAGAYGLAASPCLFHAHPPPAEAAFEGEWIQPLRIRQSPAAVLDGQVRLVPR